MPSPETPGICNCIYEIVYFRATDVKLDQWS
jgi:hypothetical protein